MSVSPRRAARPRGVAGALLPMAGADEPRKEALQFLATCIAQAHDASAVLKQRVIGTAEAEAAVKALDELAATVALAAKATHSLNKVVVAAAKKAKAQEDAAAKKAAAASAAEEKVRLEAPVSYPFFIASAKT